MQIVASFRAVRTSLLLFALACGLAFTSHAQSDATPSIQAMKLVTGQSGWLQANDRLFWTTSLGAQWSEITPPSTPGTTLHGIFFNATGSGWALQTSADQATLTIAHTVDAGAHWTTATLDSPFNSGLSFSGDASTFFSDDLTGWLMLRVQSSSNFRPGILLHTTDAGATWIRLPDPPVGGDLTFTDATHGFTGPGPRGDELFSTADAGQTWQPVPLTNPSADLTSIPSNISLPSFSDTTHGLLLRTYDHGQTTTIVRYETADGGATWTPSTPITATQSAIIALAANGSITSQIAPTKLSALSRTLAQTTPTQGATQTPVRSTFSNATQGWVLFTGGSCTPDNTCTQTSLLQGTLDGGKTFFSLGKLPGIALETTRNFARPTPTTNLFTPNAAIPHAASLPAATPLINQMGFDKCEILTTAQMQDWFTNSPYRAVGAYIGGISAACTNLGFTQSWASTVLAQGWGIIAIWVGPQAPNSTLAHKLSGVPATDQATGVTEADAAATRMTALGFGPGSIVYYDMEAYTRTAASEASTQAFVEGWVSELHNKGFQAAIYSSHPEIQDWEPGKVQDAPDAIWFAYFFSTGVACGTKCQNTVSSDIPDTFWTGDHRLRQTSSGFTSTYGTTAASIDEDWTDGPVVLIQTPNRLTVTLAGTGTGTVTSADTFINCSNTATPSTICSAVYTTGATITLTAAPSTLSTFISWTGCTTSTATTCTVTPTAAANVTATFNVTPPVFTIASSASSLTWVLGAIVSSNITITPKAPYQGTFAFSCTGLPTYLHCAFSPATVTADGSGSNLSTTLSLTATSVVTNTHTPIHSTPIQLAFLFAPLLAAPLLFRRRLAAKGLRLDRLLLFLIAISGLALTQLTTACSDGVTPTKPPIYTGNIQVVATSAGTSQQLPISVTITQ